VGGRRPRESEINGYGLRGLPRDFSMTLPGYLWDVCRWGMANTLTAMLPDHYDDEGEPVGPWRRARIHGGYVKAGETREHFLFKGIPVFRG
jgi:hypothetical protein